MSKAMIAMSGGVDSSVAALLMKEAGFECIGCTMKLYENEEELERTGKTCCSIDDVEDARSVAFKLGMPYHVFNFKEQFKCHVIGNFVDSYLKGLTPNPCIDCNHYMKFDVLWQRAKELGCDYIVTGHYAQVEEKDGVFYLKRGLDPTKDQSYVLYNMTQEQLAHIKLPLGGLSKSFARDLAEENGLINARKPDSQDICFVPDGDYAKVIKKYSGKEFKKGRFILDGKVMGEHEGIVNYTIGQHRGFNLHYHEKLYVTKIDPENDQVTLGRLEDLFSKEMVVEDFNWISGKAPEGEIRCEAMHRYRAKPASCTVKTREDGKVVVTFDEPQRAVSPGQSAVLYDGDYVLGGGIITRE